MCAGPPSFKRGGWVKFVMGDLQRLPLRQIGKGSHVLLEPRVSRLQQRCSTRSECKSAPHRATSSHREPGRVHHSAQTACTHRELPSLGHDLPESGCVAQARPLLTIASRCPGSLPRRDEIERAARARALKHPRENVASRRVRRVYTGITPAVASGCACRRPAMASSAPHASLSDVSCGILG